jgi:hypothetical protein
MGEAQIGSLNFETNAKGAKLRGKRAHARSIRWHIGEGGDGNMISDRFIYISTPGRKQKSKKDIRRCLPVSISSGMFLQSAKTKIPD